MEISGISSSVQSLTNILKQAAGNPQNLTEKLMRMSVGNVIDLNKLETIGQFVDTQA